MTSDDILRMAREAARYADAQTTDRFEWHGIRDEHFASLVAAHERAQCEAICVKQSLYYAEQDRQAESGAAGCCSVIIRARGEK